MFSVGHHGRDLSEARTVGRDTVTPGRIPTNDGLFVCRVPSGRLGTGDRVASGGR